MKKTEFTLLVALALIVFIESIKNFFTDISNWFRSKRRKPKKYLLFSRNLISFRNDCVDEPKLHSEVESITDNVRYDLETDTWEEFHVYRGEGRPPGIEYHEGSFGFWIIIDNSSCISILKNQYAEKIKLVSNPV